MKKPIIYITAIAALLTSASTFAYAKDDDGKRGGRDRGVNIERMLERLDTNGDGGISLEEVKAHQTELFGKVDADANSALTEEEFGMIREIRQAERDANRPASSGTDMAARDHKRGGDRGGMRGSDMRGPDMQRMGFERIDADNSGSVSLDEFTAMADKMFERFDRNDDGVINQDDMRKKRG